MGLYNNNTTLFNNNYNVTANESYTGVTGALSALYEGYVNDQSIFDAIISDDFREAYAVNEGAELELVTEASLGGAFEKLKEFIKKIWEKIKGLIKSFLVKINTVIIKDNKKFVEKYKAEVLKKNLSKLKYKWCEPDDNKFSFIVDNCETIGNTATARIREAFKSTSEESIKQKNEEIDDGDYEEGLYKICTGIECDSSEASKEIHDACYDTESEEEGLDSSRLNYIMTALIGSTKQKESLEKLQSKTDKCFSSMIKTIENEQKNVMKKIPKEADTAYDSKDLSFDRKGMSNKGDNNITLSLKASSNKLANDKLSLAHRMVSILQTVENKILGCCMTEFKFGIKQCRSVFGKAAAYRAKNESMYSDETFLNAVAESAAYDVESSFEDYE